MIEKLRNSIWVNRLARIVLGAIFIYASVDKIRDPLAFARIVDGYQMLPQSLVGVVAAALPFLELICGVLLVLGVWVLPGLIWVGVMLAVFVVGMAQAYARGLAIDCGCFSVEGTGAGISVWTILRDLLIVLVWAQAFWFYRKRAITPAPVESETEAEAGAAETPAAIEKTSLPH